MTESQRTSLLDTLDYMEHTLGYSLKGTPAYEQLLKKTADIVSNKPQYSRNGENHKVTIVVQVNYLQKFLQRYWVRINVTSTHFNETLPYYSGYSYFYLMPEPY